jgi:hypothetical protein
MGTNDDRNNLNITPIDSVREAELLLNYIAEQGLPVADDVVTAIVNAKHSLPLGKWTQEIEIAFWKAFNSASRSVSPATVASIRATANPPEKSPLYKVFSFVFRNLCNVSAAKWYATQYGILTGLIMAILLIVQIYFSIGTTMINNIDGFNRTLITMQTELMRKSQESGQKINSGAASIQVQIDDIIERLKVNLILLEKWNIILPLLDRDYAQQKSTETVQEKMKQERSKDLRTSQTRESSKPTVEKLKQEYSKNLKSTEAAKLLLQQIQLYLLPLFYGLLGACAFVLRTLSTRIKSVTYTDASNINYWLRIILGALSGLAFGWFAQPEKISTFASITPFALAFAAGYSVELLFVALDSVISGFIGKSPKDVQQRQKPEGGNSKTSA